MFGLTRARFAGLLTTAALVLAAGYCWRSPTPGPVASTPERGGQLVASVRSEPRTFTRLTSRDQMAELLAMLTQGKLVRINRATFEVEPWLAESWESSPDGLSHTFHLRPGLEWSDGVPLTSADVVFSIEAAFDPRVKSPMAEMLVAGGQPIRASAPDPRTVVVTFAGPSGPGVRLLDMLTVLPKHKLGEALVDGTLGEAWSSRTPPSEIVGSGPFVLRSYEPGQRLVLDRNPRYWRKAANGDALPYLNRLVLEIVPDQNAELHSLAIGCDRPHGERHRARRLRTVAARGRSRPGSADRDRRRHGRRYAVVLSQARSQAQGPPLCLRGAAGVPAGALATRWTVRRSLWTFSSVRRCPCGDRSRQGIAPGSRPTCRAMPTTSSERERSSSRSASRIATATGWWRTPPAPRPGSR